MLLKDDGIIWWRFDPAFSPYIDKIDAIFRQFCFESYDTRLEPVMTSGRDGSHITGSLHYEGRACDIRLLTHYYYNHVIGPVEWEDNIRLAAAFQDGLGEDIQVIIENTHIHIELDPKL